MHPRSRIAPLVLGLSIIASVATSQAEWSAEDSVDLGAISLGHDSVNEPLSVRISGVGDVPSDAVIGLDALLVGENYGYDEVTIELWALDVPLTGPDDIPQGELLDSAFARGALGDDPGDVSLSLYAGELPLDKDVELALFLPDGGDLDLSLKLTATGWGSVPEDDASIRLEVN